MHNQASVPLPLLQGAALPPLPLPLQHAKRTGPLTGMKNTKERKTDDSSKPKVENNIDALFANVKKS
ncbi:hypothetical protein [Wolbachia pipientis]|uniref:hypothetical protein n=1 Tax=Wolbachia pipientis TaxID=955 RepID=UPI0025A3737D|nr:hypothetical protein [Wolbachia pipientis]